MHRRIGFIFIVVAIAVFFTGVVVIVQNQKNAMSDKAQRQTRPTFFPSLKNQPQAQQFKATPSPSPKNTMLSQVSPDGSMEVIARGQQNGSQITYDIQVKQKDQPEKQIFQFTIDANEAILVPFNTWSPDNKQFFLVHHTQSHDRYLVFSATGKEFETGPYLDISELYTQKEIVYPIRTVTGWAAPNLLIVATTQDQEKGPSYWFEVSSKRFYQLSSRF